jgi:hypothetical protein
VVKAFYFDALMCVLILGGLVLGMFCCGFGAAARPGRTRFGGGADVLMLSELDGVQQCSGEAGDCRGGFVFDLVMGELGLEAGDSHAEIAGRDAIPREEKS